jgi:hypothetical protein
MKAFRPTAVNLLLVFPPAQVAAGTAIGKLFGPQWELAIAQPLAQFAAAPDMAVGIAIDSRPENSKAATGKTARAAGN